jgi:hypothetical protein
MSDGALYLIIGLVAIPLILGAIGRIIFEIMAFAVNPTVVVMVILLCYFYFESLKV